MLSFLGIIKPVNHIVKPPWCVIRAYGGVTGKAHEGLPTSICLRSESGIWHTDLEDVT